MPAADTLACRVYDRHGMDIIAMIYRAWKGLGPGLGDEWDELYVDHGGEAGGA